MGLMLEGRSMNRVTVRLADNGFVLEYEDPKVVEKNVVNDSWTDPTRSRVYETPEALVADLSALLPLMKQHAQAEDDATEYSMALNEAFNKQG